MREIKLNDFIAGNSTGVRDSHRGRDSRACGDLVRSNFCVRVVERRKAQAVAEWIERLLGEVTIGAAVHAVASEGRKLGNGFIESDRQAAGGIVVAGKDVGDGRTAFFAG